MQDQVQTNPPSHVTQQPFALLAWLGLFALIGVISGIQVLSFLKSATMDVQIYYDAAVALRHGEDMFAAWGDGHPLTYIYPPFFAVMFMPFTYLPLEWAAAVWTIVNTGLLLGCLWVGAADFMRRFDARLDSATLPVIMLVASVLFLPRIKAELDQGQVDFLVLMGITLSLFWIRRYPLLAGVALGIVANVKYQTAIFLPYFLVRAWWSASAGFALGAVGAALSGALVIGWATNLDYLGRAFAGLGWVVGIEPVAEAGKAQPFMFPMSWGESVSLSSTFARWSEALGWGDGGTVLMIGSAAVCCLVLGWWLYARAGAPLFRDRSGRSGRMDEAYAPLIALEWTGLVMASIAFSPQTKMRHMALLLIVILLVAQFLVVRREGVPRWPLLVAVIVMLIGMILPPGDPEEMRVWRKAWRAQGGPTWCVLLVYFTLVWTALRWVQLGWASRLRQPKSASLNQPVNEIG